MIGRDEQLRFVSDDVFAEARPPADRSTPLEWRRAFNTVYLEVEHLTAETLFEVNEIDLLAGPRQSDADQQARGPAVRPAQRSRRRVRGVASQEKVRDRILRTVAAGGESGVFHLRSLPSAIEVTIDGSPPLTEASRGRASDYSAGSFHGILVHAEVPGEEERWALQVCIPTEQMDQLFRGVNAHEVGLVTLGVALHSFSDEVDDALREWHYPRDLFVHGGTAQAPCVQLIAKKAAAPVPAVEVSELTEADDVAPPQPQLPEPRLDYSPLLRSIRTAMWCLFAVEFLRLLK